MINFLIYQKYIIVAQNRFYNGDNSHSVLIWKDFINSILFGTVAIVVVALLALLAFFINPPRHYDGKTAVYECGFKPFSWIIDEIDVAFYRTGLIFLLFDIEVLLLLPWSLNFFSISRVGHYSVLFILFILLIGLIYELNSHALQFYPKTWSREQERAVGKKIALSNKGVFAYILIVPSDIIDILSKFGIKSFTLIIICLLLTFIIAFRKIGLKQAIKEKRFIKTFLLFFAPAFYCLILIPLLLWSYFFEILKNYFIIITEKVDLLRLFILDSLEKPFDIAFQINSLYNNIIYSSNLKSIINNIINSTINIVGVKSLLGEIVFLIILTIIFLLFKFFYKLKYSNYIFIKHSLALLLLYWLYLFITTYAIITELVALKSFAGPIFEAFEYISLLKFGIPNIILTSISQYLTNYTNYYIVISAGTILSKIICISLFIICYIIYGFFITNFNKQVSLEITYLCLVWGVVVTAITMCNNLFLLFIMFEITTLLLVSFLGGYYLYNDTEKLYALAVYFVLSLLSTAIILFGICLTLFIVSNRGPFTLNFDVFTNFFLYHIETFIVYNIDISVYINYILTTFKLIFLLLLIPFFFKLTLFPFSQWLVSIYTRIPVPFILIILTFFKFALVIVFFNLFVGNIDNKIISQAWKMVTLFICISSIIGPYFAYKSKKLILIFVNLSVIQTGLVIIGILTDTEEVKFFSIINYFSYCLHLLAFFGILLLLASKYNTSVFSLTSLSVVVNKHKYYKIILISLLFSMIGLPIFGGFFFKYILLIAIIKGGNYAVLLSAICALIAQTAIYYVILQAIIDVKQTKQTKLLIYNLQKRNNYSNKRVYSNTSSNTLLDNNIGDDDSNNRLDSSASNTNGEKIIEKNKQNYFWFFVLSLCIILVIVFIVWLGALFIPICVKKIFVWYIIWRIN